MSKNNIYTEKESFGSRPNKRSKTEEWIEESFGIEPGSDGGRIKNKPPKKKIKK